MSFMRQVWTHGKMAKVTDLTLLLSINAGDCVSGPVASMLKSIYLHFECFKIITQCSPSTNFMKYSANFIVFMDIPSNGRHCVSSELHCTILL